MRNAVIYARYSSDKQTDQSIEGQLRVCYDYAEKNSINIVKVYVDRAMTGTNDQRADFQRMLSDSEKETFWDLVIVYAIDRFGRNSIEIAVNKQRLKKNNKTLISATQRTSENIDGTKNLDGILLENVYIGLAEYYSAELSQKVKRGFHENKLKGNYCGGPVLYGYKIVNKKFEIDTESAPIVQLIYTELVNGKPLKQIIDDLNDNGITHLGKPFNHSKTYHIVRSERYTGNYILNGISYPNVYPQIISPRLFKEAQSVLARNNLGKKSVDTNYLLRGKVICGYCGEHINGESGTARNGEVKRYYKCNKRKKHNACNKAPIKKEILEKIIIDATTKIFLTEKNIELIAEAIIKQRSKRIVEDSRLPLLEKERAETKRLIDNVMKAIEQGVLTFTTKNRLTELEMQLAKIEDNIAIEEFKAKNKLTKEKIIEYLKQGSNFNMHKIIFRYIDKIILFDDKVEIYYNFKKKENPDDNHRDYSYSDGSNKSLMVHLRGLEPRTH